MKFNEIADKILKEGKYGGWEPEDEKEAALDKKEDELISHLEKMSRVISNDDIEIEFVNIANKVLGLLKGVDPYSKNPPQLSPEQRQAAREIGGIILNRSDLV